MFRSASERSQPLPLEFVHGCTAYANRVELARSEPTLSPSRENIVSVKIRKNDDLLGLVHVKVVDSLGEVLGEMNSADALRLAQEQGLDLVEVNPKAKPPVCKILDLGKFTDPVKVAQRRARRRTGTPVVFLVRSAFRITGRPGRYLVGDIATGNAVRAGMVAHIPGGPELLHAIPIRAVEFADHLAEKMSELGLQVVGRTPEEVAALEALEGAQLIEVTEPRDE
jgi:translation initiation factor IF-3